METSPKVEVRLKGLSLSEGCVVARVCLYDERRHSKLPLYYVDAEGVTREEDRVRQAVAIAAQRLDVVRLKVDAEIGHAEAEIFVAQRMIAEDPELLSRMLAPIRSDGLNAESAMAQALDAYESRLLEVDNAYIRERASDIGEVKRRLLDVLQDSGPSLQCDDGQCRHGRGRIVVAEELTTSLTVDLDASEVKGFITERGGRNSHGAILARALGLPVVSDIPGVRDRITCGTEVLINGYTGEVIVWPSKQTVTSVCGEHVASPSVSERSEPVEGFCVMANISVATEADEAVSRNAEGVGLYRTEIELMAAGRLLNDDELYERYHAVLLAMGGRPVIYRLLDIGSDKPLPFLDMPEEENPALGWRGARLLLDRQDLLVAQARALARVSQHGAVHVMYPMVVDVDQFLELRAVFESAVADVPHGDIRHGAMFEVPYACLQAGEILDVADFASVGTNDLIQYLCAVDRDNAHVAHDYHADRPAFWKLMADMARAADERGKALSVCGELGGDPAYVARLIKAGIRTVSVSLPSIGSARQAARTALAEA